MILRPQGTGKSLLLSALRYFLEMDYKNPGDVSLQQRLFKGLKVTEDQEFCSQCMGQYPVIFLNLAGIEGENLEEACAALADKLFDLIAQFAWLSDSERLDQWDKKYLQVLLNHEVFTGSGNRDYVRLALDELCTLLHAHTGRRIVVLADGYDSLLQQAILRGYRDRLLDLISHMLDDVARDNPGIGKVIITGRLRPAKESRLSGCLENLSYNTPLTWNGRLDAAFGFTSEETRELLKSRGADESFEMLKTWCCVCSIGCQELFNPQEVAAYARNFALSGDRTAMPRLCRDGRFIAAFLPYLNSQDTDCLQALLEGKTTEFWADGSLSYRELDLHFGQHFWSVLVFAGLLVLARRGSEGVHEFRIPNEMSRQCLRAAIPRQCSQHKKFSDSKPVPWFQRVFQAFAGKQTWVLPAVK